MSADLRVVCPACGSANRLPGDRPAGAARCGRCRESLFAGHPVELAAEQFERHLLQSTLPLVVDFWAPWCAPCRAMAPAFEETAARIEPRARFAKVNTDDSQKLAGRYAIRGIPTVVIFRAGEEVDRRSGALDAGTLISWVESHL